MVEVSKRETTLKHTTRCFPHSLKRSKKMWENECVLLQMCECVLDCVRVGVKENKCVCVCASERVWESVWLHGYACVWLNHLWSCSQSWKVCQNFADKVMAMKAQEPLASTSLAEKRVLLCSPRSKKATSWTLKLEKCFWIWKLIIFLFILLCCFEKSCCGLRQQHIDFYFSFSRIIVSSQASGQCHQEMLKQKMSIITNKQNNAFIVVNKCTECTSSDRVWQQWVIPTQPVEANAKNSRVLLVHLICWYI